MEGLLTGLAEGIKSGVESYNDARKAKLAMEQKQQELAAQKAQQDRAYDLEKQKFDYEKKKGLLGAKTGLLEKGLEADFDNDTYDVKNVRPIPGYQKPVDPMVEALRNLTIQQKKQDLTETETKRKEKDLSLEVPGVGKALTEQDAKELKEATAAKKNFDSKIQEMIDLRKKHGGGTLLNREDVARGKQLSKDLLLEYKNMAKLGVLSQADEAIINAIIPEDPLQYSAAGLLGQDPILKKLESFKKDAEKDYQNRLGLRLRPQQNQGLLKQGSVPSGGPKVGQIEDGHEFLGGDPSNPASWRPVSKAGGQ